MWEQSRLGLACLVFSSIPLMPTTGNVSCPEHVTSAQLFVCSVYFLLAARPLGRWSSQLLFVVPENC